MVHSASAPVPPEFHTTTLFAPTLDLDARDGEEATAAVETADAKATSVGVSLTQVIEGTLWEIGGQLTDTGGEPKPYVVGTSAVSRPFQFTLYQQLSAAGAEYELAFGELGRLPANPTYPVADNALADLSIVLGAHNVKAIGTYYHDLYFGSSGMFVVFSSRFPVTMPSTRRHLVSATAFGIPTSWFSILSASTPTGEPAYGEHGDLRQFEEYEAGQKYELNLTTAAFTPQCLGFISDDGHMGIEFGPFNSSGGGLISSSTDTLKGDIVLKRNGSVIAESLNPYGIQAEGLTGTATYTAIMHASRQVPWSGYVPKVSGTWTFEGTQSEFWLPLISTRVSGDFDGWGRAPAGKAFPLRLNIKDAAGGVATATLRVSYNDGKTWTTVPVVYEAGLWVATPKHPNVASGYVSLRVIVTDMEGNSGGWTAYRSYKIAQLG